MSPVDAIGGAFLRSSDPAGLAAWYGKAFDLSFGEEGGTAAVLPDVGGAYSVLAFFPHDSTYIGDPDRQQAMVNLRTPNLAALLTQLGANGIAYEGPDDSEYGSFAWTTIRRGIASSSGKPAAT